ncbi:MAG: BolA family protein [Sphingomonadaceae bacterium]
MAGPLQTEMENLLAEAFSPVALDVINDSASHHGHAGDDGSGESHFTIVIVADAFARLSPAEVQRVVITRWGRPAGEATPRHQASNRP